MPRIQFSCVIRASGLSVRSVDVHSVVPASHRPRDHDREAALALYLDQSFLVSDARHQAAAVRTIPLHPGKTRFHRSDTRSFPLHSLADPSKRRKKYRRIGKGIFVPPHPVARTAAAFARRISPRSPAAFRGAPPWCRFEFRCSDFPPPAGSPVPIWPYLIFNSALRSFLSIPQVIEHLFLFDAIIAHPGRRVKGVTEKTGKLLQGSNSRGDLKETCC